MFFHTVSGSEAEVSGSGERFYDPRPYDSRYARDAEGGGDDRRRGGGRYDDHRGGGGRDRDHDRGGHRDYERGGYGGREPPPRDYREDRGGRDYERRY
jgi:transformer-2 protein